MTEIRVGERVVTAWFIIHYFIWSFTTWKEKRFIPYPLCDC